MYKLESDMLPTMEIAVKAKALVLDIGEKDKLQYLTYKLLDTEQMICSPTLIQG
jgi:hypothetical protein